MKHKNFTHITHAERLEIAFLQQKKYTQRSIAQMLRRSPNSIAREIKTNSIKGVYDPIKANHKAYVKRKYSKYQGMKVVDDHIIRTYIEEKLKEDWSPEQIAGRIKYVDTHIPYVSYQGIYKFIYSVYGRWVEPLRRHGKNKKRSGSTTKKVLFEDRTFIDQRPSIIDKRGRFGDFEADFIISGRDGSGALLVLVERKSRYPLIFKLKDRKVATINETLCKVFGSGQLVANSLTIDNDICFRHHKQMSLICGAPIFFCHPYHSWEKGGVENLNGLIRYYVPKKTDISLLGRAFIKEIEHKLQTRPRKCLRYQTPLEVMQQNRQFKYLKHFSNIKTKKTPCRVS